MLCFISVLVSHTATVYCWEATPWGGGCDKQINIPQTPVMQDSIPQFRGLQHCALPITLGECPYWNYKKNPKTHINILASMSRSYISMYICVIINTIGNILLHLNGLYGTKLVMTRQTRNRVNSFPELEIIIGKLGINWQATKNNL